MNLFFVKDHSVMSAKEAKSKSQPKMEATKRLHSLKKEALEGRLNPINWKIRLLLCTV